MNKLLTTFSLLCTLFFTTEGHCFWSELGTNIVNTWESKQYDVLIPVLAWHNRFMYDKDVVDKFQEYPWGIGFGKRYYEDKKNLHSLFATINEDSNHSPQIVLGYNYTYKIQITEHISFGPAVTAGFLSREWTSFIPIPIILPSLSIQFNRFDLQFTYIPERYNHGNVLIAVVRIEL